MLYHIGATTSLRMPWTPSSCLQWVSFRSFVCAGESWALLGSHSQVSLKADPCLRYSSFQKLQELITAPTRERTQQIKFPFHNVTDLEHFQRGRSRLCGTAFHSDRNQSVSLCASVHASVWLSNLCCRVTLSVAAHMAWGSRRCLWCASLSTSSSATLPLQQGFPHTNGLWASIANH